MLKSVDGFGEAKVKSIVDVLPVVLLSFVPRSRGVIKHVKNGGSVIIPVSSFDL